MNKQTPKPAPYTTADLARHARLATAAIGKPPAPVKGTCENCGAPTPACIPTANYCAAGVGCRADGWVEEPFMPEPEPTAAELARDEWEARGDRDFHHEHDLSE